VSTNTRIINHFNKTCNLAALSSSQQHTNKQQNIHQTRSLAQSPSSLFAAVAAMLPQQQQQNRQDNENTYNIRHQQPFPHQTPHIRRPPINNGLLTEIRSGDFGRSTTTNQQTTSIQSTSIPPTEGISSSFAVAAELRQSLQAYQAALVAAAERVARNEEGGGGGGVERRVGKERRENGNNKNNNFVEQNIQNKAIFNFKKLKKNFFLLVLAFTTSRWQNAL